MITSEFNNIHIDGICCALPTKHTVNTAVLEDPDEWGSIAALSLIAMLDEHFKKRSQVSKSKH